jgi:uncharacterized protein (TIGR00251 family)
MAGPSDTFIPIRMDPSGGLLLPVKAVPGAKRDEIAGPLGQRLKVRISAPPEQGKANKAIEALLAKTLGLRKNEVAVSEGLSCPEKTVVIVGIDEATLRDKLGIA